MRMEGTRLPIFMRALYQSVRRRGVGEPATRLLLPWIGESIRVGPISASTINIVLKRGLAKNRRCS